jgi:flagellar protein FlbD
MLIELTRIDGSKININFFQIEMVERKTNTVIRMINEVSYIVTETPAEIEEKIKNELRNVLKELVGGEYGKKKV